jgi:RNA processing factor Prp31
MANGESTVYRLQQLEERTKDHERRIRENREMLMALPYLTQDIAEIKSTCSAIRSWVEEREQARKAEESRKESISTTQWVAIIGGIAVGPLLHP